jgi:hypothetical protein
MDKKNLITMLSNADADFKVEGDFITIPYEEYDVNAIFEFDKNGNLVMTYASLI